MRRFRKDFSVLRRIVLLILFQGYSGYALHLFKEGCDATKVLNEVKGLVKGWFSTGISGFHQSAKMEPLSEPGT